MEHFGELGAVPGLWHKSEGQLRLVPVAQKPKVTVYELCGSQLQPQGSLGQGVLGGSGVLCPPKNSVKAVGGTLGPLWQCNVLLAGFLVSLEKSPFSLQPLLLKRARSHQHRPSPSSLCLSYHFKLKDDAEGLSPLWYCLSTALPIIPSCRDSSVQRL